jgi:hypothetical protein
VSATIQIAPVRKTVWVTATPQRAFEVFTAGIDRWWPKTHGIGAAPLRESSSDWKADARVAFASEVEVRFVAEPSGGTRVELEHRNFERMGAAAGEKMRRDVDGGWPALLDLYAESTSKGARE